MGEAVEAWAAAGRRNLHGNVMQVVQMEGEGGVAGALHGALQAGALATTFTCSQGLLLMIPNMYKIAGGLLPCVMHVTARTLAADAVSMFCDHQDVMGVRQTGWVMLAAADAQEAQDLAIVSHLASLKARLPFLHFFDGILTSHEMRSVSVLEPEAYRHLLQDPEVAAAIAAHRACGLNPAHPHQRGGAQGADVFMQMREAANPYYLAAPGIVQATMDDVAAFTGRPLRLFGYYGHPQAERIVIAMGSATSVLQEAVDHLNAQGQRVGMVNVHLFRPWSPQHLLAELPASVTSIGVLDRTKEPGGQGEPLYLDVAASITEDMAGGGPMRRVVGGRYGLGGKAFTPAMAVAVFDNLAAQQPRNHFTVGITDDVTMTSLPVGPEINTLPAGTYECLFWGMGSDGTVGANKEAIKIIGEADEGTYVQASFNYDAHKSGGLTVSHLRFGPRSITSSYAIHRADYMGVHLAAYLTKFDCLSRLKSGGVLVVNAPWRSAEDVAAALPARLLRQLATLQPRLYVVDARRMADAVGLGGRINMAMQAAFFQTSGVLPLDKAIPLLKQATSKSYSRQGDKVVAQNHAAVDAALAAVVNIHIPAAWAAADAAGFTPQQQASLVGASDNTAAAAAEAAAASTPTALAAKAAAQRLGLGDFYSRLAEPMLALQADSLPVSAFQAGNIMPPGTTQLERRGTAVSVPAWDPASCSQCNACAFVCPHAAIRPVLATPEELAGGGGTAAAAFETLPLRGVGSRAAAGQELRYRMQVSPLDCTGCSLCSRVCPAGALSMVPLADAVQQQDTAWLFSKTLPSRAHLFDPVSTRGSQFQQPLLEFSGACEGCGETAYVKLLTQMFGERLVIANAVGCSSVWGGWEPSNPYTVTPQGQGPAWASSLLEDNAQFGFGIYTGLKQRRQAYIAVAQQLLDGAAAAVDETAAGKGFGSAALRAALQEWLQVADNGLLCHQAALQLQPLLQAEAAQPGAAASLAALAADAADMLEKPSCWLVGGDGWAYDIGFAGLDHVLAGSEDVNVLVLDNEAYSNTGGQQSKASPLGAVLSMAAGGKASSKKQLGLMMQAAYGDHLYVASVCLEADHKQVVRAFAEAEAHKGPSLIIAYAPCVMHGITDGMKCSAAEACTAVDTGYWPLYRKLKGRVAELLARENRFSVLARRSPGVSADLQARLQQEVEARQARLHLLAKEQTQQQQE
ncbi:hypothetical protein OEZ85_013010 [Tetradesmus obliquus]|uniref:4Fe-4S ferredoxin-type domain-containing protein n=1 Tax=Tetradesmus obliquus TaxID=3088 RepID=A0ABY8U527_TETOB|nr:hypothetical protein OEZ85_013010 [Tetradesmus obliquus]